MSEPALTVDISAYDNFTDGEIEVYGSETGAIAGLLGSSGLDVDRFEISAEKTVNDYTEERYHNIDSKTGSGVLDKHKIIRETESNQVDPSVFEDMHPSVVLDSPHDPSAINLELRDPTIMVPKEERIDDEKEIYLKTAKGTGPNGNYFDGNNEIPNVEAFIRESENGTEYELNTANGHMCAAGRLDNIGKEEHLNQILDTIDMPNWETLLERKRAQQI